MVEQAPLKARLGEAAIEQLASLLKTVYPEFEDKCFSQQAKKGLSRLELKARVTHLIEALANTLPADFGVTAAILERVAAIWPEQPQGQWQSYTAWPLIDYVSVYGLDNPLRSFDVLEKLTPLFTAEFAIRPFLEQHFTLTHQRMLAWTGHENEHVRRLASEGIRPRLPWASQLTGLRCDPAPIWPILEVLKTDPSLYVRRSVANNVNDISKDHPEAVIARCQQWLQQYDKETVWVVRHGLRTLIKAGRAEVYPLLGFSAKPSIRQAQLILNTDQIKLGETLVFHLALITEKPERLIVDYRIGFRRADGRLSWKVFKWKNIETQAGQQYTLVKTRPFTPLATRQYYPGQHLLECLINGQVAARATFDVSD